MDPVSVTLGGLDLGAVDEFGVQWTTADFEGWDGSPISTLAVQQKTRQHGGAAGNSYSRPRHMVGSGLIMAPDHQALKAAIGRLNTAVALEDTLLDVIEDSETRWCMVRREDEVLASKLTPTIAKYSFQVVALDPRKMGAVLSATTKLPSFTGGLTFPMTFPFSIDAVQVSGQVSLINTGNESGPVTIRIDGPVLGPIITHSSGLVLRFAPTAQLGVGEFLEVDMDAHVVLAQGQATRANWIVERGWSGFTPGPNTWTFGAAAHSPTAQMTVTATVADK